MYSEPLKYDLFLLDATLISELCYFLLFFLTSSEYVITATTKNITFDFLE